MSIQLATNYKATKYYACMYICMYVCSYYTKQ